ncbi:MAG: DUF177 domain-containing protein [Bdellovibrionales bacterium]
MKIDLNTIQGEPLEFHLDPSSDSIKSAIDTYKIKELSLDGSVESIGDAYQLNYTLKTKLPLKCSFCAEDFQKELNLKNSEQFFIDIKAERRRAETEVRVDKDLSNEDMSGISGSTLDLNQYFIDYLGFQIPFQLSCHPDGKSSCETYETLKSKASGKDMDEFEEDKSPFSALKNLQIDKKHNN